MICECLLLKTRDVSTSILLAHTQMDLPRMWEQFKLPCHGRQSYRIQQPLSSFLTSTGCAATNGNYRRAVELVDLLGWNHPWLSQLVFCAYGRRGGNDQCQFESKGSSVSPGCGLLIDIIKWFGKGRSSTRANGRSHCSRKCFVTKMGNNLKFWPEEQEIVGKMLELLHDMAGGYSSSKLLLMLETF